MEEAFIRFHDQGLIYRDNRLVTGIEGFCGATVGGGSNKTSGGVLVCAGYPENKN